MNYPRVLIITIGRINAADADNNGLLLRNLFARWPRDHLAQIYSSGDNGDCGFFGSYYRLGERDRLFGGLFYKLKTRELNKTVTSNSASHIQGFTSSSIRHVLTRVFVDTGLYEIVFRPRLSSEMLLWVRGFQPDIIFAQGYCLTFSWIPVIVASHFKLPVSYYPTDDWPSNTYRSRSGGIPIVSDLVNRSVFRAARCLVDISSVRLAFNRYMQKDYFERYKKNFDVLMHGDDLCRYEKVQPTRYAAHDEYWIVSTGVFEHSRLPLLYDLDQACKILAAKGIRVRATVFPVNELSETSLWKGDLVHVDFMPCPSHEELVSVLKGSDILFLPERFDETAQGIRSSISSKAHLFMFSGKPIVVYSASVTGIARYAKEEGWAVVLDYQDPAKLSDIFEKIIIDDDLRNNIISAARRTILANHDLNKIQSLFAELINNAVIKGDRIAPLN